MKFFNPKEEVLDIQLTQQGKRLLSMGKFKPKYYAFYDDDIIYDSSYAGTIPRNATAATATITIIDSGSPPGVPFIGEGDTIVLISTDGTTVTLTLQGTGGSTTSSETSGATLTAKTLSAGSYANTTLHATAQAVEIKTAINNHTKFSATNSANVITVTQATTGKSGNTTITITEIGATGMSKTDFTDGTDGSSGEHQNNAEKRIKEETPRLRTQYTFTGLQEQLTKINNNPDELDNGSVDIQPTAEKMYCLGEPLGTAKYGSKFAPAWEVQFLRGRLSGSTEFATGSYHQPVRIPQLSSSIEYKTYVTFMKADGSGLETDYLADRKFVGSQDLFEPGEHGDLDYGDYPSPVLATAGPYEDNSVLQVEEDYLLLQVLEHNTQFLKDNFDIEIYMSEGLAVNEKGEQYPIYKQLRFAHEAEEITPNHVEYWFEIALDDDILDEAICDSDLDVAKRQNWLIDREIVCQDDEGFDGANIYDKDVTDPEEPC